MWNRLLVWLGLRLRPEPAPRETLEGLIGKTAELRELLSALGHNPQRERTADEMMARLKSSIRAELTDYAAFQLALAGAAARRKSMPPGGSFALLDSLTAAEDQVAVLALLNADPVYDQVPFIEQIPVRKNGETTWRSPVDHSLIRRLPVDVSQFREVAEGLESLFSEPHPARFETARLEVLDAIARLRKELDREKSYLPTALRFLDTKLAQYKAQSLKPAAAESIRTLLALTESLVELRNAVETDPGKDVAGRIAEQAARYLVTAQIQIPMLTNYLLDLLLHPNVTNATGRALRSREAKTMELTRLEIKGGYYDASETARRLRRMEALGFPVASLVYPLLRLTARESQTLERHKDLRGSK